MASAKDLKRVQQCRNREVRAILVLLLRQGERYRMTKSGITFYGVEGTAGTHFSGSEYRGAKNFLADLTRVGITIEKGSP